jgi:hypothetical protein
MAVFVAKCFGPNRKFKISSAIAPYASTNLYETSSQAFQATNSPEAIIHH